MMFEGGHGNNESLWSVESSESVVRRIWYALPVTGVLAAAIGWYVSGWRFAAGAGIGTVLAMANFRFLSSSLRSILGAGNEKPAPGTTMMFVFRWIIVATAAFAIFKSGFVTIGGLFTGLFTPAIAIAFEAVFQLANAFKRREASEDDKIQ